jgi:putative lipoic acid-binding regulatory protein
MTSETETLFTFPCDYPLKVMGRHSDDFRSIALGIVHKHVTVDEVLSIEERPSKDGKYLGLTYNIRASSKAQLDALYRELTSCEKVLIVL